MFGMPVTKIQDDTKTVETLAEDVASGCQVNPYIFAIENRHKKITKIAHEFGAGSKCLKCGPACPGLNLHFWRKICKECKCRKEEHDVPIEDDFIGELRVGKLFDRPPERSKGGQIGEHDQHDIPVNGASGDESRLGRKFDWIPPNVTAHLAEKYMAQLPVAARPEANSEGAAWRQAATQRQLPIHDTEPAACHQLPPDEQKVMEDYVQQCRESIVGQGKVKEYPEFPAAAEATSKQEPSEEMAPVSGKVKAEPNAARTMGMSKSTGALMNKPAVGTAAGKLAGKWQCQRCLVPMATGDIAVFAERAGTDVCWHPACFVCHTCEELLVDLIYFYRDGNIYCGRHFGESLLPRCAGCDELIFSSEYTQAEGQSYHFRHFCCFNCDIALGGQRYVCREERSYCLPCYTNKLARTCEKCQLKIGADVQRISHGDLHWHATESCFQCDGCTKRLLNEKFVLKNKRIFCSAECKKRVLG